MLRAIFGIVPFLFLCAPAGAQVTPTGPFSGQYHENFENQPGHTGFQPCVVGRVFSNNGDLCTPGSSGVNITGLSRKRPHA